MMDNPAFLSLAQNVALLLAAALLLDMTADRLRIRHPTLLQAPVGLLLGALGLVVMSTPLPLQPGVVFDARSILLGVTGLFFGTIPAAIATAMTAAYRLYQGGAGAFTGILVIVFAAGIGVAWRHLSRQRLSQLSWSELLLFGLAVHVVMLLLMFTLPRQIALDVLGRIWLPVLVIYPLATALFGKVMSRRLERAERDRSTRESEKRFRVIFEKSPLGVIHFDERGVILNCNQQFVELMGSSREQLIGFNTAEQSSPLMRETLKRALSGEKAEYEDIYTSVTGNRTMHLRVIFNPINPGQAPTEVIATLEDTTNRKQAEDRLEEYRKAVEHSSDIMAVVDRDAVYRMVNPAFLKQQGLQYSEVLGRSVAEVMGEDAYLRLKPFLDRSFAGQEVRFAMQMEYQNKGLRDLELEYLPILDEQGAVERVAAVIRDVTSQKQAFEKLRKNEQLISQAEGLADIGFWEYDCVTRELTLSRGIVDIHGLQAEAPSLEHIRTSLVHPEDLPGTERLLAEQFERLGHCDATYRIIRENDAAVRWVRTLAEVEREPGGRFVRVFGATQDISRQKQVEAELRESEARFRMLYMDAPVPYQSLDESGDFIEVNNRFCETLGYTKAEIIGRNFSEFLHPDWQEHFRENFPRFKALGEILGVEFELRKKDGDYILVSFTGRIGRSEDGAFRQTHCVFRDITSERREEDALRRAKEAAESASQAKSEFLANMSHELRTPLNGIMGMLQLIGMTATDAEQQQYVDMATQSCRRLARLLGDILDLSRIEAGKMDMHCDPFDLQDTLDAVDQVFRPFANQAGVELRIETRPPLPTTLCGDAARLQQVLNNLVGNALKFTSQGSVTVTASALPGRQPGETRILFSVKDTGIGIPEDKLGELFEPFTQAEGSYTRQFQGAGLGLSIVRRLLGLMNGNACVSSSEGSGTEFHVCIPFVTAAGAAANADSPLDTAPPFAPCRVLLAEDDPVSEAVITGQLRKANCDVIVAANGEQALEYLRESPCDLVLMDVQMPVMDGVEATRRIRRGEAGTRAAEIPIIALTAYAMAGDRERFLDAGMNDYLAKPVEMQTLLDCLSRTTSKA